MLQPALLALADPNRFRIVELLRAGPRSVNDLVAELDISQPQTSKHLKALKAVGWVSVRPVSQRRVYQLEPGPLRALSDWLERYRSIWDERFAAMDELLAEDAPAVRHPRARRATREPRA